MSAPVHHEARDGLPIPTMYAPPWAREQAHDPAVAAAEAALAASEDFRRALPPAPQLKERRWRDKSFEGDLAIKELRERPSLDPVVMPPVEVRGSWVAILARAAGAVGLAGFAAFILVGTLQFKGAVKAEGESAAPSLWSRFSVSRADSRERAAAPSEQPVVALAERFAAIPEPLPVRAVQTTAVPVPAAPEPAEPRLRSLDREEIAALYRRSEELIAQGDIAAARLLLTRAAEAGDARSSFALGGTYDAVNLSRLGVRGIAPDSAQARAWYAKAAELGSGDAARRLDQLAQSVR